MRSDVKSLRFFLHTPLFFSTFTSWLTKAKTKTITKTKTKKVKRMTEKEQEYRTERMVRAMVECNKLTTGCVTTGQVARRLKLKTKELYKRLQELGILFKSDDMWMLAPKYTALGLLRYRYLLYYTLDGERKVRIYPVWTERGVAYVCSMIEDGTAS